MNIECEMNIVRPEDYQGPAFDPEWKGDPVPDDEDMADVEYRHGEMHEEMMLDQQIKRRDACEEAVRILRSARGMLMTSQISVTDILSLAQYLLTGVVPTELFPFERVSQIVPMKLHTEPDEEIEAMMKYKPPVNGLVDAEDVPPAVDDE
ncbi:MAG TPA: hypothetical protein VIY48_11190 [Candidatus Paceibacterota bacterium]